MHECSVAQSFPALCNPMNYSPQAPLYFSGKDTGGGCHLLMYGGKKKNHNEKSNESLQGIFDCFLHEGLRYKGSVNIVLS